MALQPVTLLCVMVIGMERGCLVSGAIMPLLILFVLIGLGIFLYWIGYFEHMNAVLVVRLRGGQAVVERGRLSVDGRQRIEDIVREAQFTD